MTRFNAAVLDAAGLRRLTPAGRPICEPVRSFQSEHRPIRSLGSLLSLAENADVAQLWVHQSALAPNFDLRAPGWEVRGEPDAWWFAAWRTGGRRHDIALPHRNTGDGQWQCWETAADGLELLQALGLFHGALERLPRRSPGATGTALLRELHSGPNAVPLFAPAALPAPAISKRSVDHEPDLAWVRPLTDDERRHRYVHAYDKHGAYLGACSALSVGVGEAEHLSLQRCTGLDFARVNRLPGYWQALVTDDAACSFEPPTVPGMGSVRWYTTPTLTYAAERGARIQLLDGYVWRAARRPFEPWYRLLRDARAGFTPAGAPPERIALAAVKAVYTRTIGWLRSTAWDRTIDADLYRPDWADMVIAQTRTNLQRTIAKTCAIVERAPFAVYWDALLFTSDESDGATAAPSTIRIGDGLGEYGVHRSCQLRELLPLFDGERTPSAYELVARMSELERREVPA